MLKTLQTYTICIILLLVVLSLFTLSNKDSESNKTDLVTKNQSHVQSAHNDDLYDSIKDSKYAEPINEARKTINFASKSVEEFKNNINKYKDFLDIEKQINKLFNKLEFDTLEFNMWNNKKAFFVC